MRVTPGSRSEVTGGGSAQHQAHNYHGATQLQDCLRSNQWSGLIQRRGQSQKLMANLLADSAIFAILTLL